MTKDSDLQHIRETAWFKDILVHRMEKDDVAVPAYDFFCNLSIRANQKTDGKDAEYYIQNDKDLKQLESSLIQYNIY